MKRLYFVYIVMSRSGVALYTGVTNDLARRLGEHREAKGKGFSSENRTSELVWFEIFAGPTEAMRERSKSRAGAERGKKL
jgi:putative endonuclease